MSNKFGSNQVRHLFIANGTVAETSVAHLAKTATVGTIKANKTLEGELYVEYMGAKGILRSDLIKVDQILSTCVTPAVKMARPIAKKGIFLSPNVNSGSPVTGQDYVVTVEFKNFYSPGDDSTYVKTAAVHAYSGMTADEFAVYLAVQLKMNFSREPFDVLDIYLASYDGTDVTLGAKIDTLTTSTFADLYTIYGGNSANGIVLVEKVQEYEQGLISDDPVNFVLTGDQITYQGDNVKWSVVKDITVTRSGDAWSEAVSYGDNLVGNGRAVADLEWGSTAYRGDTQKDLGWPNRVKTYYLSNPETNYDMIDIHYYFVGDNDSSQRSEKTLSIAIPTSETDDTLDSKTTAVVGELNRIINTIDSSKALS